MGPVCLRGQDRFEEPVSSCVSPCFRPLSPKVDLSQSLSTHGQFDARPTLTFPASEHHHPATGTDLYCLVIEAGVSERLAGGGRPLTVVRQTPPLSSLPFAPLPWRPSVCLSSPPFPIPYLPSPYPSLFPFPFLWKQAPLNPAKESGGEL